MAPFPQVSKYQCTMVLILSCMIANAAALAQTAPATANPPAPAAAPLELVVLGSGGPGAIGRAGSSYLLLLDGTPRILVDAGPGAFVRLGEAKLSLAQVDIVLLTHLHADHAGDLPGLFKARAVSSGGKINFTVFGPRGRIGIGDNASFPSTRKFVDLLFGAHGAFASLHDFSAPMTIKATDLNASATPASTPKKILVEGGLAISAIAGHHRDAPAMVYRVDYRGKSVTFSGDIDPQGHADLRRIAKDTNLLVFNSVVLDPPGSPAQLYGLHTPPKGIGEIATGSRAGKLLLSHLSPAVDGAREAVTASVKQRYAGQVMFAEVGLRLQP